MSAATSTLTNQSKESEAELQTTLNRSLTAYQGAQPYHDGSGHQASRSLASKHHRKSGPTPVRRPAPLGSRMPAAHRAELEQSWLEGQTLRHQMLSNQFARYLQLQASIDNIPPEKRARTEAEMSGLPHELPNPPASRTPATLEFALLRVIAQDGSVLKEYDARKENVQISLYEKESGAHLRQNTIKLKKAFPGMAIDAHFYDWKVDAVVLQLIPDQSEGNEADLTAAEANTKITPTAAASAVKPLPYSTEIIQKGKLVTINSSYWPALGAMPIEVPMPVQVSYELQPPPQGPSDDVSSHMSGQVQWKGYVNLNLTSRGKQTMVLRGADALNGLARLCEGHYLLGWRIQHMDQSTGATLPVGAPRPAPATQAAATAPAASTAAPTTLRPGALTAASTATGSLLPPMAAVPAHAGVQPSQSSAASDAHNYDAGALQPASSFLKQLLAQIQQAQRALADAVTDEARAARTQAMYQQTCLDAPSPAIEASKLVAEMALAESNVQVTNARTQLGMLEQQRSQLGVGVSPRPCVLLVAVVSKAQAEQVAAPPPLAANAQLIDPSTGKFMDPGPLVLTKYAEELCKTWLKDKDRQGTGSAPRAQLKDKTPKSQPPPLPQRRSEAPALGATASQLLPGAVLEQQALNAAGGAEGHASQLSDVQPDLQSGLLPGKGPQLPPLVADKAPQGQARVRARKRGAPAAAAAAAASAALAAAGTAGLGPGAGEESQAAPKRSRRLSARADSHMSRNAEQQGSLQLADSLSMDEHAVGFGVPHITTSTAMAAEDGADGSQVESMHITAQHQPSGISLGSCHMDLSNLDVAAPQLQLTQRLRFSSMTLTELQALLGASVHKRAADAVQTAQPVVSRQPNALEQQAAGTLASMALCAGTTHGVTFGDDATMHAAGAMQQGGMDAVPVLDRLPVVHGLDDANGTANSLADVIPDCSLQHTAAPKGAQPVLLPSLSGTAEEGPSVGAGVGPLGASSSQQQSAGVDVPGMLQALLAGLGSRGGSTSGESQQQLAAELLAVIQAQLQAAAQAALPQGAAQQAAVRQATPQQGQQQQQASQTHAGKSSVQHLSPQPGANGQGGMPPQADEHVHKRQRVENLQPSDQAQQPHAQLVPAQQRAAGQGQVPAQQVSEMPMQPSQAAGQAQDPVQRRVPAMQGTCTQGTQQAQQVPAQQPAAPVHQVQASPDQPPLQPLPQPLGGAQGHAQPSVLTAEQLIQEVIDIADTDDDGPELPPPSLQPSTGHSTSAAALDPSTVRRLLATAGLSLDQVRAALDSEQIGGGQLAPGLQGAAAGAGYASGLQGAAAGAGYASGSRIGNVQPHHLAQTIKEEAMVEATQLGPQDVILDGKGKPSAMGPQAAAMHMPVPVETGSQAHSDKGGIQQTAPVARQIDAGGWIQQLQCLASRASLLRRLDLPPPSAHLAPKDAAAGVLPAAANQLPGGDVDVSLPTSAAPGLAARVDGAQQAPSIAPIATPAQTPAPAASAAGQGVVHSQPLQYAPQASLNSSMHGGSGRPGSGPVVGQGSVQTLKQEALQHTRLRELVTMPKLDETDPDLRDNLMAAMWRLVGALKKVQLPTETLPAVLALGNAMEDAAVDASDAELASWTRRRYRGLVSMVNDNQDPLIVLERASSIIKLLKDKA